MFVTVTMSKHIIFLPCSIYDKKRAYLYGVVHSEDRNQIAKAVTCYYILNVEPNPLEKSDNEVVLLGLCQDDDEALVLKLSISDDGRNEMEIHLTYNNFEVFSVLRNNCQADPSSIVVILYDDEVFRRSELLLKEDEGSINYNNHFEVLVDLLRRQSRDRTSFLWSCLQYLLGILLFISNILLHILLNAKPVFQYFALGSRLHAFLDTFIWALTSIKNQRKVSLKVGNCILATAVDISAGILLLHFIDYMGITTPLSDYILKIAKDVVHSLQYLLQWLSGSPAGLKLNGPFNVMMGRFFMYHIKLWWVFLSLAQPLLELVFTIFLGLGRLGVTFQAAILSDLLVLVSFHIHCIYVYAAKVYYLQLSGLRALWRLFLGRKYNPLRERVDSCQYSPDQLFVGTLAFTILLFLLPTTLMYYVVFTAMRLFILVLSGIFTQACFIFHALPVFATVHWILGSNSVCSSVYISPKSGQSCSAVVLFVTPVADSWWNTVKRCLPDTVVCPPRIQFGQLLHKLAVGELVYPV